MCAEVIEIARQTSGKRAKDMTVDTTTDKTASAGVIRRRREAGNTTGFADAKTAVTTMRHPIVIVSLAPTTGVGSVEKFKGTSGTID